MARIKIYSTGRCPLCEKTKALLGKWQIPYDELKEMQALTDNARTVPQIAIDGKWIGGFTDLTELHMEGELDDLMPE